jgi:hypothetical protein
MEPDDVSTDEAGENTNVPLDLGAPDRDEAVGPSTEPDGKDVNRILFTSST